MSLNNWVLRLFTKNRGEAGNNTKKSIEDPQFKEQEKIEDGSKEENKFDIKKKKFLL